MPNKTLLDTNPGYPLQEYENWVTNVSEMESGAEVRISPARYPKRQWTLAWRNVDRTTKAEAIREAILYAARNGESFFWKEPVKTSRNRIKVSVGDGTSSQYLMPIKDWDFCTIRSAEVEVYEGIDYEFLFGLGQNGLDILSFHSVPAAGAVIELDYTDGYYYPLVYANVLEESLIPAGWDVLDMDVILDESKEDR